MDRCARRAGRRLDRLVERQECARARSHGRHKNLCGAIERARARLHAERLPDRDLPLRWRDLVVSERRRAAGSLQMERLASFHNGLPRRAFSRDVHAGKRAARLARRRQKGHADERLSGENALHCPGRSMAIGWRRPAPMPRSFGRSKTRTGRSTKRRSNAAPEAPKLRASRFTQNPSSWRKAMRTGFCCCAGSPMAPRFWCAPRQRAAGRSRRLPGTTPAPGSCSARLTARRVSSTCPLEAVLKPALQTGAKGARAIPAFSRHARTAFAMATAFGLSP